jgi:hypothetical protein
MLQAFAQQRRPNFARKQNCVKHVKVLCASTGRCWLAVLLTSCICGAASSESFHVCPIQAQCRAVLAVSHVATDPLDCKQFQQEDASRGNTDRTKPHHDFQDTP